MLRGVWIVRKEDSYVPLSRRFPLAERKHRKQVAASSASAIPEDVELGADLVRKAKGAKELGNNSPLYEHVVEAAPNLWPMVVLDAGHHLVAVLPLVPPAALSQHDKVKQEAAETGFGLKYHTALASILEPIPSVYVAVETAVALARVLGEKDASSPQKQGKPGWAEAYDRVWKVILDGIPGGPCIEVNADNLEAMFDNQHSNKPRRRWF